MRKSAELGGGTFLTRSSEINVQGIQSLIKLHGLLQLDSFTKKICMVVEYYYMDDEANPLSCIVASD